MHPFSLLISPLYKWPTHCPLLICHVFPCLDKYGSRSYCIISFFFPIFCPVDSACWSSCGMHIDLLFRSVLTSHAKGLVNYVFLFCSASSFPIFLGPLPCSHIPGIICTWRSLPHFPVYDSDFQWGSTSGLVSTFLTKALISCFSPLSVLTYVSFLPEQDQTACFSKASACKTRVVALKIEG